MKAWRPPVATPEALIEAAIRGELDQAQMRRLCRECPDLVTLALLAATKRIAEQNADLVTRDQRIADLQARLATNSDGTATSPATPSGMIPIYTKPPASKRGKKPGAKNGHRGSRRPSPPRIDRTVEHRAPCCPNCGGPLTRGPRTRKRTIEDLPETLRAEVVEHLIHRDYCPHCHRDVEPVVPDAMPNALIGHRLVTLTGWFHYGLGVTISQVIDILSHHLQTRLTAGGLVDAWRRLALVLRSWYEEIAEQARRSAVLHADETGWRVNGQTCWLWCFANHQVCYYMVDRSRGSPALQKFFVEAFAGTLVHDFWAAYLSFEADDRQYCLVHLLRELEKVDEHNRCAEWQAFAKKLRRLIHDGIRLRKRPDFTPLRYERRITLIDRRLTALAQWQTPDGSPTYRDADTLRLAKRLRKHWNHLFTFLDKPEVPFENNLAERMIRPAVIIRKNSLANRSETGAATQAILMSVYRTLRLRGHDPIRTVAAALRSYVQTGQLPPLPDPAPANG